VTGIDADAGSAFAVRHHVPETRPRSLDRLAPFEHECLLVVIETPKGSPNKLAFEPRYGTFVLKGVLPAGGVFPFDFGFVPSTHAEDGDPLDVLVLMDAPVYPGCVVPSRLIGVIEASSRSTCSAASMGHSTSRAPSVILRLLFRAPLPKRAGPCPPESHEEGRWLLDATTFSGVSTVGRV
jgi:hypothetical protein